MNLAFSIYRYNPDVDTAPRMQEYQLVLEDGSDIMVLDALIQLKEQDQPYPLDVHVEKVYVVLMVLT